ncbi:N-acetylmuramoyl-L-alanine amidase [Oceanobacillus senegalensis]|uniref:N-acetylmuramoyl-L-alanine amidase n=1 Tax=Oceanobacillus senegalensis TaxID=1936063 RepID=UPI0015C44F08|nr:N-acetylmuramoyl-L-alanine amidase [Oceanobacillus senegalensis]
MLHKKSYVIIGLIIVAFFSSPKSTSADNANITADHVNVRSGPGTQFAPIGQANTNDQYPILDIKDNWIKIEFKGSNGWIIADYVNISGQPVNLKSPSSKRLTIPFDNTQIRSGPSIAFEIITFANRGETFNVISQTTNWIEVSNGEYTGFLNKALVQKSKSHNEAGHFRFKNKNIVLDAGHGGHDVGAIGATGTYEKDFAYFTTLKLKNELSILGANVLLTRPNDEFISLKSRASYANISDADVFISIHYNSFPRQQNVKGIETYYYHEQNQALAQAIQEGIIQATNAEDRGTSFGDFYVLRQNFKPAVLVELGFISNQNTEKQLQTSFYQKRLVNGIINGLRKHFANQ